jgi:hypothetical protein
MLLSQMKLQLAARGHLDGDVAGRAWGYARVEQRSGRTTSRRAICRSISHCCWPGRSRAANSHLGECKLGRRCLVASVSCTSVSGYRGVEADLLACLQGLGLREGGTALRTDDLALGDVPLDLTLLVAGEVKGGQSAFGRVQARS